MSDERYDRSDQLSAEKARVRSAVIRTMDRAEKASIAESSRRIQRRVLGLTRYREADGVCCYLATPREVQTDEFVRACWRDGKELYAPARARSGDGYGLVALRERTRLVEGPWRIMEPDSEETATATELDLIVIPGVAFDRTGARLGHGGGHYDRVLARTAGDVPLKVGLAFSWQIVDRLPRGAHDVPMDLVVTEEYIIHGAPGAPRDKGKGAPA